MKPACDNARRARPLLGTFVEVAASGARRSELDAAIDRAFHAVADVHRLMSFHEPDSDVSRLNREASTRAVRVHPWTYEVLGMSRELYEASAGLFDIAVTPVLEPTALRPGRDGDRRSVPMIAPVGEPLELLPGRRVRFPRGGVRIDLGGIAKGFAVDRALDVLRAAGVACGLVNAGGDLAAFGPDAAPVHIRDPRCPGRILCRVDVRNEALASSGGFLDPFRSSDAAASAVIDPSTRRPARRVYGATVRAPSCVVADALTKVVMIAGAPAATLLARYGARAMFVSLDGDQQLTGGSEPTVRCAT